MARLQAALAVGIALALLPAAPAAADPAIAGTRPAYTDRALTAPPNAAAIRARMWVPEIDLGYVPQGIAVVEDAVLLAAYNSEGGMPRCRLYRIDRERLAVTGRLDMPAGCAHAGGLAYAGGGRLFLSDTGRLYEIDLARAFDPARSAAAVVWSLSLRFPLKGSFLAFRGDALWVGVHAKPNPGEIYELPLAVLATAAEPSGLSLEHVRRSLPVAPMGQGAAFDRDGFLWLSHSNSQQGSLQKLDPQTGAVLATHAAVPGIEDLGFDADGGLWAVGEAGARRWHNWPTFYPVLFAIDVGALR